MGFLIDTPKGIMTCLRGLLIEPLKGIMPSFIPTNGVDAPQEG
jgi:hypothetical protein